MKRIEVKINLLIQLKHFLKNILMKKIGTKINIFFIQFLILINLKIVDI